MIPLPPSYRRAFGKSRHHVWLAILTLGLGFATGEPLGLVAGAVLYALGWVFLPDTPFFRRTVDQRAAAEHQKALTAELARFRQEQEQLEANLSSARRHKYRELTEVCQAIRDASVDTAGVTALDQETRYRKLDELRHTYLRMLSVEQSLEVYLETERKEQIPMSIRSLEAEIAALMTEVTAMKAVTPAPAGLEAKERLLTSRLERLSALNQRMSRIDQAKTNHDLLLSEQQRLVEQVKLIRADAIASRNPENLTARIDLSIEHLAATNQWLSELADFRDLTGRVPAPATAAESRPGSAEPASRPPLSREKQS